MVEEEYILNQLDSLVSDNRLKELEVNSLTPNLFQILGLERTEIRHSNFLAYLFNPKGNHNLGDFFFKSFINVIDNNYPNNNFSDLIVEREREHIDLLMYSEINKVVVIIENKIDAKEGNNQLERYKQYINSNKFFKNHNKYFIYLTKYGDESSDPDVWRSLDYSEIKKILEEVSKKETVNKKALTYIKDYLTILESEIMNNDEIRKKCKAIYYEHKEAIDLLMANLPTLRDDISECIMGFLKEHQNEYNYTYMEMDSGVRYMRFIPNEWGKYRGMGDLLTEDYLLYMEVEHNINGVISIKTVIGPSKPEFVDEREKLFTKSKEYKNTILNMKGDRLFNKWKTLNNEIITKNSDKLLSKIIDGKPEYIKIVCDKLESYFKDKHKKIVDIFK